MAGHDIPCRAKYPLHAKTGMCKKGPVLFRNDRLNQKLRELIDRDDFTTLFGEKLGYELSASVEKQRWESRPVRTEFGAFLYVLRPAKDDTECRTDSQSRE